MRPTGSRPSGRPLPGAPPPVDGRAGVGTGVAVGAGLGVAGGPGVGVGVLALRSNERPG